MSIYLGRQLLATTTNNPPSRNIGEIVTSTIPLTDAGLHLLDGSLISGNGSYVDFVDYIADLYDTFDKLSNVNIVGSITDNNGVLSGFTTSNYATLPLVFNPSLNTWEIVVKFNLSDVTTQCAIFTSNNANGRGVRILIYQSKVNLGISYDGSTLVDFPLAVTTLQNNTDYWVKVVFTGTAYKMYLSTTGAFNGEESLEGEKSSNTAICSMTESNIGRWVSSNQLPCTGSIDLNESYINISGERWWTGRNPIGFTDEATWQATVDLYDVCGKFVYNNANNTVRLPKITGIIEGTTDITALGDLVEAGLPNITASGLGGGHANSNPINNVSGAFTRTSSTINANHVSGSADYGLISFDASRSNSIYGNSSTVQPQTIKVLYYIVIATIIKTEIEVDIDEIITDLNEKVDKDQCVDISSIGAGWSMPSYTIENLILGASGATYTAPANGYFCLSAGGTGSDNWIEMTCGAIQNGIYGTVGWNFKLFVPAQKGQVLYVAYQNINASTANFRFIYAQGSESEAS